jgi:hypothetical protein
MKELVDQNISKIFVSAGFLVFITNEQKEFAYLAEGDCCSQSWFADILNVKAILGKTITKIENISLEQVGLGLSEERFAICCNEDRTLQEYDSFYCHRLYCDKNYCDVIYRNSSNGHYGGWTTLFNINNVHESVRDKFLQKRYLVKEITDDWTY